MDFKAKSLLFTICSQAVHMNFKLIFYAVSVANKYQENKFNKKLGGNNEPSKKNKSNLL
jgi:hypothetical protein